MTNAQFMHLASDDLSLLLEHAPNTPPVWRHFGARRHVGPDTWRVGEARPHPPTLLDNDPALNVLPTHGFGWFYQPALSGSRPDKDGDFDWAQSFVVSKVEQEPSSLVLHLIDKTARLGLIVSYTLDLGTDVVSMWSELKNDGATPFRLDWLAAACVPLPPDANKVLSLSGRWTLEFQEVRETLGVATWRRDNRRGRTSHDAFPGVMVGSDLHDDVGATFGVHLGWSGNHTVLIEPLNDGGRQLQIGEWLAPGEVLLEPGERYRTPTAYLSFSELGLNGVSANFHRFVRQHVLHWPGQTMSPRPVHLNTWEAVYCDHSLDELKALASAGAAVGVERFVLDDGWFHQRNNDLAGLGDWWPDAKKYPNGLLPLIDHVRQLGMQFGLWVEPEMVNPDSTLFRTHPDWVLSLDGRHMVMGRNQLVLDLANPDVTAYLFEKLSGLLHVHPIAYLKWDMNRDLAAAGHHGRAAYRRQVEATFRLLADLRNAHPTVEIESCASGGGRADYGMLEHTHRIWTSDCNDPLTRIDIQRGFLRFFPPEVMGAHIGPACSHTTGRRHDMAFRAMVAIFGHLGLEMDVRCLTMAEKNELSAWIALYKEWRGVVHRGILRQGGDAGALAWLHVTANDQSAALCAVYRRRESVPSYIAPLRLAGLDPARNYWLKAFALPHAPHYTKQTDLVKALASGELMLSGATLRDFGVPLPPLPPESAVVIGIRAVPLGAAE